MVRFLPIILATCVVIVSGLISAVGMNALAFYEKATAPPVPVTCEQMLTQVPDDAFHIQLTDWKRGKSIYPNYVEDKLADPPPLQNSDDKNRPWESVYVCFFPKGKSLCGTSYNSVIVLIKNVNSVEQLRKILDTDSINFHYRDEEKDVDSNLYSRMAQTYRSMDFSTCIVGEAGAEPPSKRIGENCYYGGIAGIVLSVIGVVLFYLFKFLRWIFNRNKDPWFDEEAENAVSNRAGLPAI